VFIDRFRALLAIVSALFAGKRAKLFSPGGNNICGVLGQIGALLELAEQIENGEMPDPTAIYLPYGSGCTTTGLTIGVALARHLGMDAFKSPDFKIVGVIVHHAFAAGQAKLGFLHWHSAPLSVAFGIDKVCSEAWWNLELFPFTRAEHLLNVMRYTGMRLSHFDGCPSFAESPQSQSQAQTSGIGHRSTIRRAVRNP
jgi:hypothetical protein